MAGVSTPRSTRYPDDGQLGRSARSSHALRLGLLFFVLAAVASTVVYLARPRSGVTSDATLSVVALVAVMLLAFATGFRTRSWLMAVVAAVGAALGSLTAFLVTRAAASVPALEFDAIAWYAAGAVVLVMHGWGIVARILVDRVRGRRGAA